MLMQPSTPHNAPTIHYETAAHVLCGADTPGAIPFVSGGQQPGGLYLYKIDLDKHSPQQDPDGLLAYLRQRIGDDLAGRLCIRHTKRSGYHILTGATVCRCAMEARC
jgi:hypothetical protein